MQNHRLIVPAFLAMAGFCALPATAAPVCTLSDISASPLTYSTTGCFNQDDDEQSFIFTLNSTQTVNMFTTSWITGGFAPILTLFDGGVDSNFIAEDTGGQVPDFCGSRGLGGGDGLITCLDAYLTRTLDPGTYRLVLTESAAAIGDENLDGSFLDSDFNTQRLAYASCANNQEGFSFTECGNGNFTGQGGFHSPNNGDQLSNTWAVTISANTISTETPEPTTGLIGFSGLLLTGILTRRRLGVGSLIPARSPRATNLR